MAFVRTDGQNIRVDQQLLLSGVSDNDLGIVTESMPVRNVPLLAAGDAGENPICRTHAQDSHEYGKPYHAPVSTRCSEAISAEACDDDLRNPNPTRNDTL